MNIEVLLGRSEIYDILTHLTFLYLEADKIRDIGFDMNEGGRPKRVWKIIEEVALGEKKFSRKEKKWHWFIFQHCWEGRLMKL